MPSSSRSTRAAAVARRGLSAAAALVLVTTSNGAAAAHADGASPKDDRPKPEPARHRVTHPEGFVETKHPLDGRPHGVSVSSAGVVYASLIGSTQLARGDVRQMRFRDHVTVGARPPQVALSPAGNVAYAALQGGRGVAVVDVASNALVATLPLESEALNLIVSPDGRRLYVTTVLGTLHVVDTRTRERVARVDVGATANGLALSPDGRRLYVSSRDAGTVTAVDLTRNAVAATYRLGGRPQGIALSPDGRELYAANEAGALDVVRLPAGAVSRVRLGTPAYGVAVTPDGKQLYVSLSEAGTVRVLDRATKREVKTILVGGTPRNVAFDASGETALVANEQAVVFIR
ncbi:MAG: YncE family protein [Gemmatimonadaceae bacterium]